MDPHTSLEGLPVPLISSRVTPVTHNDEWATPQPFADVWIRRLRLDLDVAASPKNAKLPTYWTQADDALTQSWGGRRVWCNPPWSQIDPWVQKALQREADVACLLLPARTDRPWQRALRQDEAVHVQYVGRVSFVDPDPPAGRGPRVSPREGAMIAVIL